MRMYGRRYFKREFMRTLKANETKKTVSPISLTKNSTEQPTESGNTKPPAKKSKRSVIIAVCIVALIITLITIGAVSCSNNRKIFIDNQSVTTQNDTITFSATAKRKKAEEYKSVNIVLNIYDKSDNKIYCDYNSVTFWNDTISVPTSFKIDKYLVPNYKSYNFEITERTPALSKPQNNHKFSSVSKIEPATCSSYGTKYLKCSHCEIIKPEKILPLGHNFVLSNEIKATCTVDGTNTYKCSRCTQTKTETTKAIGHNWGETDCLNCRLKMQQYRLTMKNTLISNGGVGNEWSHSWKYNNKYIQNGAVLYAPPDSTISVMAIIIEHDDASSDVGVETLKVCLTNGYVAEGEVVVVEDRGKYARSKAVWRVTITVEKIS